MPRHVLWMLIIGQGLLACTSQTTPIQTAINQTASSQTVNSQIIKVQQVNVNSTTLPTDLASLSAIEPPLVTIPAGVVTFPVDSNPKSKNKSTYDVQIKSFMVAKYEVTKKEFRKFIADSGYQAPSKCMHAINGLWYSAGATNGSWDNNNVSALNMAYDTQFKTSEFDPVTCINPQVASDYAAWLSQKTGKKYRLLSTAEWVYAAQGGKQDPYYKHQDKITSVCEYENIADHSAIYGAETRFKTRYKMAGYHNKTVDCDDKAEFISLVGMYKPNPFGLHDMVGNLTEFTADCIDPNKPLPSDGSPQSSDECKNRGNQGSSWHWPPFKFHRIGSWPATQVGSIEGFRLARDLTIEEQQSPVTTVATPPLSTKLFVKQLTKAQKIEQARRDKLAPIHHNLPAPQQLEIVEQANNRVKLAWQKIDGDSITYRVYRGEFLNSDSLTMIASGLTSNQYIDRNPVPDRRVSYVVKAEQGRSTSAASAFALGSPVYKTLPAKVEAEQANNRNGAFVWPNRPGDGKHIRNLNKGQWLEYTIDVPQSAEYQITYQLTSNKNGSGFKLTLQDKMLQNLKIEKTQKNRWRDNFQTLSAKVTLPKGQHKLKLESLQDQWKLDWIDFVEITHR
ncbi:hypothetical protein C2869_03175 [Saccharobesus litoralis]|uniref:Uncharacterized protein n=1 Tax=Saccharobesus litoralis TaxID=2172099 RepID=A0A2S0VMS3_9ALTE|nr:SUMF1/EgtB/PvdO family nonheme iron enzyme [Saccharobesus litoralis]AWB65496.1 hypothetical protein C2869_03175 [Saccharobesus litoralis]